LSPWRRRSLLLALLGSLSLTGCKGGLELPNVLYLALSTNSDQAIDADLLEETQARLSVLERGYRQMHPASRFQFGLYADNSISNALIRRNRAGLGPDVIYVNGETALQMLADGVVSPFPATPEQLRLFDPDDLDQLRTKRGELAGLPVVIQTQVACFNRKRLPKPPATVAELLAASAAGHPVGLTVDPYNLYWSTGSLGALKGINQAIAGQQPSPAEVRQIEQWLAWLQNASTQQRVTFYSDQKSVIAEFLAERIDWMPCNSISIPKLRKQLGSSLGVSALPSGPDGSPPSPMKRLRVFALGSSSSVAGRDRAIAFIRFSANPLMQRMLTVGSQTLLPANRFVKVPVQSSQVLAAMELSNRQSDQFSQVVKLMHDHDPRIPKLQAHITELVFGEESARSSAEALIQILRRKP
jgi:maltose-binding protein MalE